MREGWKNLALAAASLGFTLLLIEFVLLPFAFPFVPLKLHAAFPRGVRVLAQSSKSGAVPHHYLALLGDSYAQGYGDWLLDVNPNTNPPFHSAHVLFQRSGRDVISFGASGAGSLRGLASEPVGVLGYLRLTALFRTADPDALLVYFYEGNDVDDNVRDLGLRWDPQHPRSELRDRSAFRRFIAETVVGQSPLAQDQRDFRFSDNFLLTRAFLRGVHALLFPDPTQTVEVISYPPGRINRAEIGGREVALPDRLQSPALALSEQELDDGLYVFEQALAFLRDQFPHVPTTVVYLPSPLSCYRIRSPQVSIQLEEQGRGGEIQPRELLALRSDRICRFVADAARAAGAGFVDPRTTLWPLAARQPIHGPRDWKHFNRSGYEALAEALLPALSQPDPVQGSCLSLTALLAPDSPAP